MVLNFSEIRYWAYCPQLILKHVPFVRNPICLPLTLFNVYAFMDISLSFLQSCSIRTHTDLQVIYSAITHGIHLKKNHMALVQDFKFSSFDSWLKAFVVLSCLFILSLSLLFFFLCQKIFGLNFQFIESKQ